MIDPNAGAVAILRRTQPWVRLASIIGFVAAALTAVFGADAAMGGLSSSRLQAAPLLLLYAGLTLFFLVPSMRLHRYARRMGIFIAQGHTVQLEAALEAERAFWKSCGLFAMLGIVVFALGLVLAII